MSTRLSEDRIKEAILHPDLEIRDRAISYFSKSSSPSPGIMPLIIRAVETYGREGAYQLVGSARDLPQTEETIDWVLRELNDERCNEYESYAFNLSMIPVEAPAVALLVPREKAFLEARHFLPELRAAFTERLRMQTWDAATCWQKLEQFSEKGKDKRYTNEVPLDHARRIVEALARFGPACEERVLSILSRKIDDSQNDPLAWLEPLAVRLAGQARLTSALPLIVARLLDDAGDLDNEECAEAFVRIGTPAVLEAVAEAYPAAPHHFRLYATAPLERIHSDLAVEKCLHLLGQEKDDTIQMNLAEALLIQFAPAGIESARQLLLEGQYDDFTARGLRALLLETCTIMGERFPEYDEWLAAEKAEKEEHQRRVKELEGDHAGLMLYALERLAGEKAPELPKPPPPPPTPRLAPPPRPAPPRRALPPALLPRKKVGRNDPCPCGSGKKFKNCCLRK